jgi:hypothetical protein
LGTRVGDNYEWITLKETVDNSECIGAGLKVLGLIPDIEAEDRLWRFIGIQSKNRKEWALF